MPPKSNKQKNRQTKKFSINNAEKNELQNKWVKAIIDRVVESPRISISLLVVVFAVLVIRAIQFLSTDLNPSIHEYKVFSQRPQSYSSQEQQQQAKSSAEPSSSTLDEDRHQYDMNIPSTETPDGFDVDQLLAMMHAVNGREDLAETLLEQLQEKQKQQQP